MAENRFVGDTFIGLAWHEDGTPFTLQDYRDFSGPPYPTKEQLALWQAEEAAANERERRRRT